MTTILHGYHVNCAAIAGSKNLASKFVAQRWKLHGPHTSSFVCRRKLASQAFALCSRFQHQSWRILRNFIPNPISITAIPILWTFPVSKRIEILVLDAIPQLDHLGDSVAAEYLRQVSFGLLSYPIFQTPGTEKSFVIALDHRSLPQGHEWFAGGINSQVCILKEHVDGYVYKYYGENSLTDENVLLWGIM